MAEPELALGSAVAAWRHTVVLARLELRRLGPALRRMGTLLLLAAPFLFLWGGEGALAFGLGVIGTSVWMQGPMELLRDRIRGDLLFLSTLPVAATTVAAGKFVAVALTSGLSALLFAGAAALVVPAALPAAGAGRAATLAFACAWIGLSTAGFAATALLARFSLRTLTDGSAPLALMVGFLAATWALERTIPQPWALVEWLLERPWLPAGGGLAGLLLAALVARLAFRVTAAGIRDYEPEPDVLVR